MQKYAYDVSIILVNYKTSDLVFSVIESIENKSKGFTYEIIVVDNSNDINEFNKLLPLEKKSIKLIDAKENLGFWKANNLGASVAQGKYLHFLNTDTLLINNAIYELKAFLDQNANAGIAGSNLYTTDNKPNHSFDFNEKNLRNEIKDASLLSSFKRRILRKRSDFNYSDSPIKLAGCVVGASLMISSEDFSSLGGFDKDIFMYAEESLLCYRLIHELHKDIFNVPTSKIIHFEGGSQTNSIKYEKAMMWLDGTFVYYQKAFGNDIAIKFLKKRHIAEKRKYVLYKILRLKKKTSDHYSWMKACEDKLKSSLSK